ncbi:MAG: primosomal protein N' [Candidatus Omnitrophica bacterium]|jgi:primosomal protein N' (replication factor Y)|nr:primosomal protein N' [Candidatus Omnitrophota bacterium]
MQYAQVVLGLPIDGPFDYIVPQPLEKKIGLGQRVKVNFRGKKEIAYVTGISGNTDIRYLKSITDIVDAASILDKNLLALTKKVAEYYSCSWGEAIETAIPQDLRKGKKLNIAGGAVCGERDNRPATAEKILLHCPDQAARWKAYFDEIKAAVTAGRSCLFILPDIALAQKAAGSIKAGLGLDTALLYRKQTDELKVWQDIRQGKFPVVVGTRSAIFAPLCDPGLIIVDEEQDYVYKQDQTPHYHCREAAMIRAELEKNKLILGSSAPSLESYQSAKDGALKYVHQAASGDQPQIQVVDMKNLPLMSKRQRVILSQRLQDKMLEVLGAKGKSLLFINRKGFATLAVCSTCAKILKCPRCNINLVYHFSQQQLRCHYCNHKIPAPKICPLCNSGYIRYSGAGTEKIESELALLFPQAKVKLLDDDAGQDLSGWDIIVSGQAGLRGIDHKFDLVGVLDIDRMLNQVDFRSAERVFELLTELCAKTERAVIIQSSVSGNYALSSLEKHDPTLFYEKELDLRKQLNFPPYSHFCQVRFRGANEEKVKNSATQVFEKLEKSKLPKGIKLISLNPAEQPKLRGNYYWVILISSESIPVLHKFLKINLKKLKHSGIIVTIDVDSL